MVETEREQGEVMTTLENRPNTALLIVDVQNGAIVEAHGRDAVVANVCTLVEKARRAHVPVVWIQHSDEHLVRGSDDWRIVSELTRHDGEPHVKKSYANSFEARQRRPHNPGPDPMGAPPPEQVIAHTNLYWTYHSPPGRIAGTVETNNVDFGAAQ